MLIFGNVLQSLILQIVSGILGLWLAIQLVPGVAFADSTRTLVFAGIILGLVNFFIKPVVKLITLPLRIITLGLFGIIVNMAMIWIVDIFFPELIIEGIIALFWTSIVLWLVSTIFSLLGKGKIS